MRRLFILAGGTGIVVLVGAYLLLSVVYIALIVISPAPSTVRRLAAMVTDYLVLSLLMHLGDEAGTPLYLLYLWITFGYGFRYGVAYLALAAQLAAGIKGLEEMLELPPPTTGDLYASRRGKDIPATLRAATETLRKSKMQRAAFGDDVVDHFTRTASWEQEEFDRVVTDYEVARGFERS